MSEGTFSHVANHLSFTGFIGKATKLCNVRHCQHLCVPTARNVSSLMRVTCLCVDGFELNSDQRTCRRKNANTLQNALKYINEDI